MSFAKAISVIKYALEKAGTAINMDDYDGAIVKKLAASNTLDEGRTTNQTHIAITGSQMDVFPYLCADGYFYDGSALTDVDLKKYFVIRIPVTLYESNLRHLGYDGCELPFSNGLLHTSTSVVRSKRIGQADQLQVSMLDMDGEHFVAFRKLMHTGTYFILLKRKTTMQYDAFGINTSLFPQISLDLSQLNNKFFKASTNTVVDAHVFNDVVDLESVSIFKHELELLENTTISEDDFRVWLSQRVKKDGQLLSTTYQNAYYYILKAIPSMLGFESVFSITDPVTYDRYRQRIEASPQYQEANPNVGVGTLSAALTNYGLYLDERHMINIPIERLGQILKDWCEKKYVENNITSTLVGFGFKYARAINKAKVTSKALLDLAKIESAMAAYIDRGKDLAASIEKDSIGITILPTQATTKKAQESIIWFPRTNTLHPLNSILYGAPGTGKTYITAEYALAILENRAVDESPKTLEQRKATMGKYSNFVDEGRIVFTTFHQSYAYEDFIQGLRPVSANGGTEFNTVDGVFKRIADIAKKHPNDNYVIIIDEINRANISKVFGELITLIEDDKRWGEVNALQVTLPSGDSFAIPNNLYIVGTMNSADKSISLIDIALRRRFEFIEVTPNASLIADPVLRSTLEKLNASLAKELDSTDLLVGHAYFIGKTEEDLCSIFNRSIIPLLYEYFYDNSAKVKAQIKSALPNDQYEITGGTVGRIKISKK